MVLYQPFSSSTSSFLFAQLTQTHKCHYKQPLNLQRLVLAVKHSHKNNMPSSARGGGKMVVHSLVFGNLPLET